MSDAESILHAPLHYVVRGELYVSGFSHIVAEGVTA